jgi:hypothetical protein
MRRYSADEEQRIRTQDLVREWTQSGLLDAAQGETLGASLRVELRRTNPFLRAGLALFTALIIAAFVALVVTSLDLHDRVPFAIVTSLSAIACIGVAEFLVGSLRCYRFGVEEVFAMAAVVLLAISADELASAPGMTLRWLPRVVGLLVASTGAFALYRRFGFVYAALGSLVCAAAIPFQLDLAASVQRALAAAVIGAAFGVARSKRLTSGREYPGDEYSILQAAALAGVYVALNVQITGLPGWGIGWPSASVTPWFYWCTYALTWILPAVGFRLGIRDRDGALVDVSLLLAIVTLVTSKPYLGWARNTWDPIVFGIVLIGAAVAIRRWLENGPGGARDGWTAARILEKDRAALSLLGVASALVPPGLVAGRPAPHPETPAPQFGGGRSGGAGGGDTF